MIDKLEKFTESRMHTFSRGLYGISSDNEMYERLVQTEIRGRRRSGKFYGGDHWRQWPGKHVQGKEFAQIGNASARCSGPQAMICSTLAIDVASR